MSATPVSSMASEVRQEKVRRLKSGGKLKALDLFSGCGGLSLGFHAAGFEIVGAVESDPIAAMSHALNFCHHPTDPKIHGRFRDISQTQPEQLIAELKLGQTQTAIDVIIGGPPC